MLKRLFSVKIPNKTPWDNKSFTSLELPATPYELSNALGRSGGWLKAKPTAYMEQVWDFDYLAPLWSQPLNLFALNMLAEKLSEMDYTQRTAFRGLAMVEFSKMERDYTVERFLDLAYSTECCHVLGDVHDDAALGRFYAENGFLPQYEELRDDVFNHLNFTSIGKEIREKEGGVFVPLGRTEGGYVIQDEDLRFAPTVPTGPMEKPEYTFRLTLSPYDFSNGETGDVKVDLDFPATREDIDAALEKLDVSCWAETVICDYDGPIPWPEDLEGSFSRMERLNDLARAAEKIEAAGRTLKYNAVLEATGARRISEAIEIAESLDEYTCDWDIKSVEGLAWCELTAAVGEADARWMGKYMDLQGYGNEIMERYNGALTDYGYVVRGDGQPIQSFNEQPSQSEQGPQMQF